jgi:hypothetical protein
MRYFDKDGREIDAKRHHQLADDPNYTSICSTVVRDHSVRTVWVGTDEFRNADGHPLTYRTVLYNEHGEMMVLWSPTLGDALDAHQRCSRQVFYP